MILFKHCNNTGVISTMIKNIVARNLNVSNKSKKEFKVYLNNQTCYDISNHNYVIIRAKCSKENAKIKINFLVDDIESCFYLSLDESGIVKDEWKDYCLSITMFQKEFFTHITGLKFSIEDESEIEVDEIIFSEKSIYYPKINYNTLPVSSSIILTTHGKETFATSECLERIRKWKKDYHELIVVVHDESYLLQHYLLQCEEDRLIDKLIFTTKNHGHTKGMFLGFEQASNEIVFNITVDTMLGTEYIIDSCSRLLNQNENSGGVGWFYQWGQQGDGNFWINNKLHHNFNVGYSYRNWDWYDIVFKEEMKLKEKEYKEWNISGVQMREMDIKNIENSSWYTGKVKTETNHKSMFGSCGSFFGTKKTLWNKLEGYGREYCEPNSNYWADDFYTYAVTDQGKDFWNLPVDIRRLQKPEDFDIYIQRTYDRDECDIHTGEEFLTKPIDPRRNCDVISNEYDIQLKRKYERKIERICYKYVWEKSDV